MKDDHYWMAQCLELARQAAKNNEVPVGALIVSEQTVIGTGWNRSIELHDPTAHAEIIALRDAGNQRHNYRLPDTTMYVTLEPCAMCAGAIIQARLSKLVYATSDPKTGACGSILNLLQTTALNHQVDIVKGIMHQDSRLLLQNFFKAKRIT